MVPAGWVMGPVRSPGNLRGSIMVRTRRASFATVAQPFVLRDVLKNKTSYVVFQAPNRFDSGSVLASFRAMLQ
ncbi:hypothetical protein THS27_22315 [Thalassospira sp. MCCC 1A01428]|nr:hypothetical protein THS27_22315 [Thalassospira sp. MCCC 1A01428]